MLRILIVDESQMTREMLRRRLEQHGYEVLLAANEGEALPLAQKNVPDVALIALDRADGNATMQRLRTNPLTQSCVLIGLSEQSGPNSVDSAVMPVCDDMIHKPVQMPKLIKAITTLTANRPKRTAPDLPTSPLQAVGAANLAETGEHSLTKNPDVPSGVTEEHPALPKPISANKCILVVEDTDINRALLVRRLTGMGFLTAEAENGRVALEKVRSVHVDVVLLDVMMPEVDGYQVLQEMKQHPDLRAIPIIMMSANDSMESIARCIEMGAEDYLPKPVDPVLLRARIDASMDKRRLRDQEMVYLRAMNELTQSAAKLEAGKFEPGTLANLASRDDEVGQLARMFQKMAEEVQNREQNLQKEVLRLKIEIDDIRKAEQVMEITESDYFQQLQTKAQELRQRFRRSPAV